MANKEYKTSRDMPIYKKTQTLSDETAKIMFTIDRDFRHTLGQRIYLASMEQLSLLDEAEALIDKREEYIKLFINRQHTIEEMIKQGVRLNALDESYYIKVMPLFENIEKQARGWFNATQAKLPES